MPGCTVNDKLSPQFNRLREHWRRSYPHVDEDLASAFKSICENILSKKASRLQAGSNVVVYKYRQNSSDIKRGESYGWRILALYDVATAVLYPVIIYPKTAWQSADSGNILTAIRDVRMLLGYCPTSGCDGRMENSVPEQRAASGEIKTACLKCGAVHWKMEAT